MKQGLYYTWWSVLNNSLMFSQSNLKSYGISNWTQCNKADLALDEWLFNLTERSPVNIMFLHNTDWTCELFKNWCILPVWYFSVWQDVGGMYVKLKGIEICVLTVDLSATVISIRLHVFTMWGKSSLRKIDITLICSCVFLNTHNTNIT